MLLIGFRPSPFRRSPSACSEREKRDPRLGRMLHDVGSRIVLRWRRRSQRMFRSQPALLVSEDGACGAGYLGRAVRRIDGRVLRSDGGATRPEGAVGHGGGRHEGASLNFKRLVSDRMPGECNSLPGGRACGDGTQVYGVHAWCRNGAVLLSDRDRCNNRYVIKNQNGPAGS